MSIKKLNPIKTRLFNFFTNSFQNSKRIEDIKKIPREAIIKVLISRPNHRLGNQLLITPLIQEVKKQFPNCKIDLVVNGTVSSILFSEYDYIEKLIQLPKKPFNNILSYLRKVIGLTFNKYDIAIVGCEDSNSSKIFVKLSRAKFKIYNSGTSQKDKPAHIAKYPIYNLRVFLNPSEDKNDTNYPKLSLKLTKEEIKNGELVIHNMFKNDKKTISIFTFATGRKCHSKGWWSEFYPKLKSQFPEFNILEILPMENVSQIDFQSEHFYSKDLREIASVMEASAIFVGADSGMMHLSVATNTPTIGLFNVTKSEVYTPYGHQNQSIDTTSSDIDELMDRIKKIL